MRKPEREIAAQMVADAAEAVELIVAEGVGQGDGEVQPAG